MPRPTRGARRAASGRSRKPRSMNSGRVCGWMSRLPVPVARGIVSFMLQLSFVLWPKKRRWVNDNFAHVLGKPPGSLEVRRKALAAYRSYARYVVELMRLPSHDQRAGLAALVDTSLASLPPRGVLEGERQGPDPGRARHIGNLEVCRVRGIARHWLADRLARRRHEASRSCSSSCGASARTGASTLIPWRNMRDLLRRAPGGTRSLALIIDWGYRAGRHPGPDVRGVDHAAGGPRRPRRQDGRADRSRRHPARPRTADVPGDAQRPDRGDLVKPAELRRATQAIADALAATIAAAPEQWYSFKPIWPPTPEEQAALAAERAGRPGRRRADCTASGPARRDRRGVARVPPAGAAAPRPCGPRRRGLVPHRPERRRRARRNLTRVVRWLADHDLGSAEVRAAAHDGRALNRLVRGAFRHAARYYVQLARAPIVDLAYLDRWLVVETPDVLDQTMGDPRGALFVGMHMGWFELPGCLPPRGPGGRPSSRPRRSPTRPCRPTSCGRAAGWASR